MSAAPIPLHRSEARALTPQEFTNLSSGRQIYTRKPFLRSSDISFRRALLYGCVRQSANGSDRCREFGDDLARKAGKLGNRRGQRRVEQRKDGRIWTDDDLAQEARRKCVQRAMSGLREKNLLANIARGPKAIDRQFRKHPIYGHAEEDWGKPYVIFGQSEKDAFGLPPELMRDPNLTAGEKAAAAVLLAYGSQSGKSFPSHARIAKDLGCSRDSVKKSYIPGLVRKGIIRVEKERRANGRGWAHNVYVFLYRDEYAARFARAGAPSATAPPFATPAEDRTFSPPIDRTVSPPKEELLKKNPVKNGNSTVSSSCTCSNTSINPKSIRSIDSQKEKPETATTIPAVPFHHRATDEERARADFYGEDQRRYARSEVSKFKLQNGEHPEISDELFTKILAAAHRRPIGKVLDFLEERREHIQKRPDSAPKKSFWFVTVLENEFGPTNPDREAAEPAPLAREEYTPVEPLTEATEAETAATEADIASVTAEWNRKAQEYRAQAAAAGGDPVPDRDPTWPAQFDAMIAGMIERMPKLGPEPLPKHLRRRETEVSAAQVPPTRPPGITDEDIRESKKLHADMLAIFARKDARDKRKEQEYKMRPIGQGRPPFIPEGMPIPTLDPSTGIWYDGRTEDKTTPLFVDEDPRTMNEPEPWDPYEDWAAEHRRRNDDSSDV